MVNTKGMSPAQIRMVGLKILSEELGPDAFLEFLHQYEIGEGDYSKERHKMFEKDTVRSLSKRLFELQEEG